MRYRPELVAEVGEDAAHSGIAIILAGAKPDGPGPHDPLHWLIRVAKSASRKEAQRVRRERAAAFQIAQQAEAPTIEAMLERDRREREYMTRLQAIDELPEKKRDVLKARGRGETFDQIAKSQGIPAGTARSIATRAKTDLRRRFADTAGSQARETKKRLSEMRRAIAKRTQLEWSANALRRRPILRLPSKAATAS